MEEQEGKKDCEHEWVYDNNIVCTNPPISHKICKKCGRVEHEQDEIFVKESFAEIMGRFEKKGAL